MSESLMVLGRSNDSLVHEPKERHMLRYGNLGIILLAVFLILFGLVSLGVDGGRVLTILMALAALAAGILLLINREW